MHNPNNVRKIMWSQLFKYQYQYKYTSVYVVSNSIVLDYTSFLINIYMKKKLKSIYST